MPSLPELQAALPRHERLPDLLAASDDPHPRKTCRIKWVGDYNPMDDDRVLAKLLMGRYTPLQKAGIERAAAFAKTPVGGVRSRLMEHDHQHSMAVVSHLGRSYCFSPLNNYICHVDYRDVDVLLGDPDAGHEFRNLDDPNTPEVTILVPGVEVFTLISLEVMDRDTTPVPNRFKAASH